MSGQDLRGNPYWRLLIANIAKIAKIANIQGHFPDSAGQDAPGIFNVGNVGNLGNATASAQEALHGVHHEEAVKERHRDQYRAARR